jgi:arginine decarboxylase
VRMDAQPDRRPIVHGSVMEHIGAVATCEYGESATAGLIFGWLYDDDGDRYGGLVCEYSGGLVEDKVPGHLREMLNELHTNGYEHFALRDIEVHTRSVTPEKMYGTALVAICFQSYLIPVHVPRGTRSNLFLTVGER